MSPFAFRPGSWWRALVLALCVLVTAPAAFAQSDTTAPTVTGIELTSSPTSGVPGYRLAQEVEFTLTFSEAVQVVAGQSAPELALRVGTAVRAARYASGDGTTMLVFSYMVAEGDMGGVSLVTSPLRNAGSITDLAGNPLSGQPPALPSGATAVVDGVRPTAQMQLTPVAGDARQYDLRITFSESVEFFDGDDLILSSGALVEQPELERLAPGGGVATGATTYVARVDVGACFAGEFRVTLRTRERYYINATQYYIVYAWQDLVRNGHASPDLGALAAVRVDAPPPPITLSASRTILDEMHANSVASGTTAVSVAVTGRGFAEICRVGLSFGAPMTSGATLGQDYYWWWPVSGGASLGEVTVRLAAGETTATGTVWLRVLSDYLTTEGEEQFTVGVRHVRLVASDGESIGSNGPVTPADVSQLSFTIRDHAPPGVTVEVTPERVAEWDPARTGTPPGVFEQITFTAILERPVGAELTIRLNTDPNAGTATRGTDYRIWDGNQLEPGAFIFPVPPGRSRASASFWLQTVHDEAREGDETVVFTAEVDASPSVPGGATIDSTPTVTLFDPPPRFDLTEATGATRIAGANWRSYSRPADATAPAVEPEPPYFVAEEGAEVTLTPTNLEYFGESVEWVWAELDDDAAALLGDWKVNQESGAITFTAPTRPVGYLLRLTATAFEAGRAVSSSTASVVVGGGGYLGICARTSEVRTAILAKLSAGIRAQLPDTDAEHPCSGVTRAHLAGLIGDLNLGNRAPKLLQLQAHDFAGLISLTGIELRNNALTSLPDGIFEGLTSLEAIILDDNVITDLGEDPFRGLSNLERIALQANCLWREGLPRGVFEGLTSLSELDLRRIGHPGCPIGAPQTNTTFEFEAQLVLVADDEDGYEDTLYLEVPEGALQDIEASITVDGTPSTVTLAKGQVRLAIVEDVPLSAPVDVSVTGGDPIAPASGNTFNGFTMSLVGGSQMVPPAPSVITLSASSTEFFEGGPQVRLTLAVTLDHHALDNMDIALAVDASATNAASESDDYTLTPALAPLTLARGELAGTFTVDVAIVDDDANEGDEVIAFRASHGTLTAGQVTFTIRDDDDGVVTINNSAGLGGTSPAFTADEDTAISLTAGATNFAGPVTWRWTQNEADPVQVIVAGVASTSAALELSDLPGRTESYDLRLRVAASHDPGGGLPVETTALEVTIQVSADDDDPVIVVDTAISAEVGTRVLLEATATDSDEGQELTLAWTGPSDIPLEPPSNAGARTAFTAPDTEQVLTFTFSADDGTGAAVTREVVVTVVPSVHVAAVSGAAPDSSIPDAGDFSASEGAAATFTATATGFATAPGGFVWTQDANDVVQVLSGVDTGAARLTLDLPNRSTDYTVRLTATAADAPGGTPLTPERSRTVTVSVAASDAPPVIDEVEASSDGIAAGETIAVPVGARVTLRGAASDADPDQTLALAWRGIPALTLTPVTPGDPSTVSFDATVPPGLYTFTFTADDDGNHPPTRDEVVVGVVESMPVLTIAAATSSVPEGGNATFVVTADPVPATTLTVSVTVSGAADFLAHGEANTWLIRLLAGRNMATLNIFTVDDREVEAAAPVTAVLGTGRGYRVGAPSTAEITIEDDDMAPEAFTVSVSGGAGLNEKTGVSPGQAFTADEGIAAALTASATGLAAPLVWHWSQSAGDEVQALSGVTAINQATLSFMLPSWHEDYDISLTLMVTDADGRSHSLSVRIEVANANGICDRTEAVYEAILARIAGVDDCNAVTATQLSGIDGELDLSVGGGGTALTALQAQDFAGLTALQRLRLGGHNLSSLPPGVFGELTALTLLDLSGNDFSSLPSGFFAQLTSLSHLDLSDNALTAFPAGLSRELSNLETLDLSGNRLDMLSADALEGLDQLESLSLADNRLAQLPAGLFGPTANLVDFNASGNELQSLPQGLFVGLALRYLNLDANRFTALPSGVFTGLGGTGLRIASFTGNPKAAPSALALTVTMEEARDERGVVLRVAEGAPAAIVFTLEVEGRSETVTMAFGDDEVMHLVSAPAGAAVTLGGQLEWQLPDPTMVSMEAPTDEYGYDQTQWAVRGIGSAAPALTVTLGEGNEVSIAAASSSVVAGEDAMFVLMATEPPEIALTISVELSGGAAVGVADGPREVVLAPGADRATLIVPTTSTGMSALVATVSDTASYRAGLPSAAVVTVESTAPAAMVAVSIAAPEPSVREGGQMILTVMADEALAETVTVTVDVAGAALAEDVRAHEVEIGNSAMGTLTVRARANDTVYQGNDTIIATIRDGTGYQPGLPSGAVVTVWDDEKPPSGVGLSVSPEEVTEGDGTVTVTVTAMLEGGHPFAAPTTVGVTLAASGRMELSAQPMTLPIALPAGARSATETFDLTAPSDDGAWRGDGMVTVSGAHDSLPVTGAMVRVRDRFVETVRVRAESGLVLKEALSPGVLRFGAEEGADVVLSVALTGASGPVVSHAWSQAADDEAQVLTGVTTDAAELRFRLPDRSRAYTLNLTLTTTHRPGGGFAPTSVTRDVLIEVSAEDDTPAIAWASADTPGVRSGDAITVSVGDEVTLFGVATDPDSDQSLLFAWRGPPEITLASPAANSVRATFTAPDVAGTYTFTFEADDDGAGGDAPVTREVTVRVVFDVSITPMSTSVTEGTPVTLSLTAHRTPAAPFRAVVLLSGGGAFGIADRNRQVTFGAGVSMLTLVLPTDDDDIGEENATLAARVADGEMSRPETLLPTLVTIADDDIRVSIAPAQSTVDEGTAASFVLTAHGIVATAFTVNVNVSGGETFGVTATVETVSFAAGATTAPLNVSTTGDNMDEPDGTITATVMNGPGYGPGTPASASMTVRDNDLGVSIERGPTTPSTVTEDASVEFVVRADELPATPLTIAVSLSGGADFGIADGSPPQPVILPANTLSETFTLTPEDDNVTEPARVLTATVTSGTGYQVGASASAMVTLADNDIEVGVFAERISVGEGSPANFVVTANEAPAEPLAVTVNLSGGAGFSIEDGPRTVEIEAGETQATLRVDLLDDEVDDADARLDARVQAGPGYQVGVPASASTLLLDNDLVVSLSWRAEAIWEGQEVVLDAEVGETLSRALTVTVEISGDLGFLPPGIFRQQQVVIPASRSSWGVRFTTHDNLVDEPNGRITATLVPGADYVVGAEDEDSVAVWDNDIGVSIEAADAPVLEGGFTLFTVRVHESLSENLTLGLDLTRRDLSDERRLVGTPETEVVTIVSGTSLSRILVVRAPDDNEDGPGFFWRARVESVVSVPAGYSVVRVSGGADEVEVLDNDLDISITPVASTVTEGESAQFLLTSSEVAATPLTVAVNLSVGAGDDFGVTSGARQAVIGAGATVARLVVPTMNDDLDETNGTLTATVTGVTGYNLLTAAPSASVTVRDEDVEVSIESLTATVTEGEEASFRVTANEAPTTALTVSVELSGGDSFGVVSARSRKVVVPAGGTTATLPVPTEDDDEPDAPRTLTATIAAGAGYTPESGRASATAQLTDDEAFGTPDVNADDAVTANDALILYYAYSLRSSLGTGR